MRPVPGAAAAAPAAAPQAAGAALLAVQRPGKRPKHEDDDEGSNATDDGHCVNEAVWEGRAVGCGSGWPESTGGAAAGCEAFWTGAFVQCLPSSRRCWQQ